MAHPLRMFPLGSVLFPYALLPLHVFEPRYRVMMRHCLDGDRELGVVLIERGSEVGGGDVRFATGTVARIVQASELPDGRWAVATVGTRRCRVVEWLPDDPYPRALVDEVPGLVGGAGAGGRRAAARLALQAVVDLWRRLDPRVPGEVPAVDDDPVRALWELAAVAPIGPLDAQRLLESDDLDGAYDRLDVLLSEIAADLRARLASG